MPSRRQVLAAGSLALVGGSGCARVRDAIATDNSDDETTGETTTSEETGTGGETTDNDAAAFRVTVTDDGDEVELVTGADVAEVGDVRKCRSGGYQFPVTLTEEGSAAFADGLERVGALDDPQSHRVRTYFEGEMLYEAKLAPGFVETIGSGEWDGEFLFTASDRETAEEVKAALESE